MNPNNEHRRPGTRFSRSGRTVFVRLRVDRRSYEFARSWAVFHADADPYGTAEDQLEGYLNMALLAHMAETGWSGQQGVEADYPETSDYDKSSNDMDDGIPF